VSRTDRWSIEEWSNNRIILCSDVLTTSENREYLIVIAEPERRLQWTGKDIRAENNLLNDLGFNLCVVPWSPVIRLVTYFGVVEVIKTEVLSGQVEELKRIRTS